jgi:Zn-dependent protease with chaperone function
MDFFASQDSARKKTKVLVGYFALAVIGLILSLYLVFVAVENWSNSKSSSKRSRNNYSSESSTSKGWVWWDPTLFLWSSIGTITVIFLGSGYKTMQLAAGGSVVAKDLGGRLLDRNTTDTDERRLLNVVEEMSIAAGMPVPDVYLMDGEDGINAFAAGHTPGDAVIGVTRGCVRTLTRDELQGVMAHEFSHILNGDMKMNLRLIGMIHGILIIAIVGRVVMRIALESGGSRNSKENNFRFAAAAIGGAVMGLGYLGVLFGHLIKSAISRQREYLADASAVQFTRNPDGIAGALKKIGGIAGKSYLQTPHAEEASHMMFGQAMKASLFDSHPTLDDRIKRISPSWNGEFPDVSLSEINSSLPRKDPETNEAFRAAGMAAAMGQALAQQNKTAPANNIGEISHLDLTHAKALQASMPAEWGPLLRNPAGAQAMMFALILSEESSLLEAELATLRECVDEDTLAITLRQHQKVQGFPSSMLIAVIDLAIPALRRLSPDEYRRFTSILHKLMASDQQIDLFEFMVQKILRRHLDVCFNQSRPAKIQFNQLSQLVPETHAVLSVLARAAGSTEGMQASYQSASSTLADQGINLPNEILETDWTQLDTALDRLDLSAPLVKKQLLYACGKAVMADGSVIDEEAELLRAVADTMGCPIPPFALA